METIQRISITDEAAKAIKNEIVSGRYGKGDKLPTERELCETLGVGRSTVREALRILQAMDLVELRQGRGAYVRSSTSATHERVKDWLSENAVEVLEFMEVRTSIELLAIKLAVERATDSEIERIGEINDMFTEAARGGNEIDCATIDEAFHSAIVETTHNRLMIAINQELNSAFRPYRLRAFAVPGYAGHAVDPHNDIFTALRDRDERRAAKSMEHHLTVSKTDINKAVQDNPVSR